MEPEKPMGESWESMSPVAPPTAPGELGALRPDSRWPTSVGVCGIVYASFGLIGGCGTFASAFASQFIATMTAN